VNEHGCRLITTERTPRLGSGEARPVPIHEPLAPRDVVLLMTDGVWGPLTPSAIHATVMACTLSHLADLPPALLDLAGARERADDMTVVALRALR
jgi:serine/threonine protein phosphatase PrpC